LQDCCGLAADEGFFAPCAHLRQARILLDLEAPALVFGEMPVESVELVQGEQINEFLDE